MKKIAGDIAALPYNSSKPDTTMDDRLTDRKPKPVILPKATKNTSLKDNDATHIPILKTSEKPVKLTSEKHAKQAAQETLMATSTLRAPVIEPTGQARVKGMNLAGTKHTNVSGIQSSKLIPNSYVTKSDSDLKDFSLGAQKTKHHHFLNHPQTIIEDEDDTSEDSNDKPTLNDQTKNGSESTHKNKMSRVPTAVELHTQSDKSNRSSNTPSLNDFPIINKNAIKRVATGVDLTSHASSGSPNFRRGNSVRSLRSGYYGERVGECGESLFSKPFSDQASIRSWASVGLGSTDGKKMIIRRVPTSPEELFTIVNPPTPPEEYMYDEDSDEIDQGDEDGSYSKPMRYQWSNKLQFVLACVGYSVGLGSVWRFPYLCYKSGGGVFLIPYFITMLVCGVPLLYMELAVGQYTGRGPIGALGHLCPLFKGTGLGSVVISFLMSTYYSVIIAYGIYYFFTSFKSNQPWADCNHRWNTKHCWVFPKSVNGTPKPMNSQTPSEEFFEIKVLQTESGIEHFHQLRWELVACLICAWVLVYFAIWKSIKSSGRVRYFTATLPFLLILLFLAKSLTLEGADRGLRYFFKPKWSLLGEAKVWVNAAAQTFNSMGIAFGSMISFASYNKYNNNILQDTVAVSLVNLVTSLLVGVFAFATIGNIATEHNSSIEDVITDGPGLIFVVYPQAIAQMPASNLWAILFFFMLLCLALNSQFATVEVVVTSIHDGFPVWIKNHLMCHEILVLVICLISAIFGLPYVTKSGIYFFQLMDHYTATISKMYLAFFEVVAIAWVYGGARLSRNVKTMTGKHPGWYFKFCWVIATPMMIISLWIFLLIDYAPPTYNNGSYEFPHWAIVMGWAIASVSLLCIPIFMIYVFVQTPGESIMDKLKNSIKPDLEEKCLKCGDLDCDCIIEETMQPMLVLQSSDGKGITSGPTYIPIQSLEYPKKNGIMLSELNNLKRDSLESGHHQADPITIHVETTPPSESSLSSKESKT